MEPYATITIEMSKAGLHCICDDIEEDVCNPDIVFSLTEKGKKYAEELKKKGE